MLCECVAPFFRSRYGSGYRSQRKQGVPLYRRRNGIAVLRRSECPLIGRGTTDCERIVSDVTAQIGGRVLDLSTVFGYGAARNHDPILAEFLCQNNVG